MLRRPPTSTRTYTRFPYTTLFRSLGQRDHAGLGGAVGRRIGVAFLAGDRGDIDDAAIALMLHRRHHGTAAVEHVGQVDIDHLLPVGQRRSEEHTSELQSLMRTSYVVFCLK